MANLVVLISFSEALPPWAIPRFADFSMLRNFSVNGRLRWAHRFLKDRLDLLWRRMRERLRLAMRAIAEETWVVKEIRRKSERLNHESPNEFVQKVFARMRREAGRISGEDIPQWFLQALLERMGGRLRQVENKWNHVISTSIDTLKGNAHPLLSVVLESFFEEQERMRILGRNPDPRERILQRGPGFIPTPSKRDFVKAFVLHSVRNASLHLWEKGHPGLDAQVVMRFYDSLCRCIERVALPSNLDDEEKRTLEDMKKDENWVYVQTDKT